MPTTPMTGALELVVHSSAGPDVVQPLEPHDSPNYLDQFTFHGWVPWSPAITGFTIRRNGITLAQTHMSAHAPQVSIVSPMPGDTYIGVGHPLQLDRFGHGRRSTHVPGRVQH